MRHQIISLISAGCFLMSACTSDMEELQPVPSDDNGPHTVAMHLDGGITRFDEEGGAGTRATTADWADGAKLYIQYTTTNGTVDGTATYSESTGEWTVSYYGSITRNEPTKCEVYYFENAGNESMTAVTLTEQSAVFCDTEASYLYKDGEVTVTTTLKPQTGRIRFRGTADSQFTVDGLKWYSGYNISSNALSQQSGQLSLTVGAGGYTPYVYSVFADASSRQLAVIDNEGYTFKRSFDSAVLTVGKSGYINVPTVSARNGWSMEAPTKGTHNGHDWVDLGLSVKWATTNVGATNPGDYGDYFAWGETTTKSSYSWSTYKYGNSSTALTKYCTKAENGTVDNKTQLDLSDDAACANWGGSWRMPTGDEFRELFSKCTWTWTSQNGHNGYRVTGPNGNSIFLPAAGFRDGTGLYSAGSYGRYWSSSLTESYPDYGRILYFTSSNHRTTSDYRCYGKSVRPVTE